MSNIYDFNNQICGVVKSPYDIRDYKIVAVSDLPEEYSTAKVHVKNQRSESTCVAHALSSVIEYHYKKLTKMSRSFSTEFIYGYRESSYYIGDGMVIRDALKTIQKYGDPYQSDCIGNNNVEVAMTRVDADVETLKEFAKPHKISAYVRLNTIDEMKTAIMNHGPIVVSMTWHGGYKLVNNVYTYDNNNAYGRHCVMIYGWNKDGWLVQNSWGMSFGENGRFIVPYSFKFNEAWGIIDDIDDTKVEVITPSKNKFKRLVYSVINIAVNVFIKLFKKDE